MRYFYNYAIMYETPTKELKAITMTADNPKHLQERFYKYYPSCFIITYVLYNGVYKVVRKNKKLLVSQDDTQSYIESLSVVELYDSSVSDIYDEYYKFCCSEGIDPVNKYVFSKRIIQYYNLKSKIVKRDGKSIRVYKEV